MKILFISTIDKSVMLKEFADVFMNAGFEFYFTSTVDNNDVLKDYYRIKPNIVLVHKNRGFLNVNIWSKMKCYKIWWTNDDRYPPDKWRILFAPVFDLFLVASHHSVRAMKKLGTDSEYLIMGIRKKEDLKVKRDNNLVFLGNNNVNLFPLSKFRATCCKRLIRNVNGFVLGGLGWGSNYKKIGMGIYHKTKIGLSIGHQDYDYVYSNRMIEIMGHGAMCLSYRVSKLEEIFIENETCVYFNDYDELLKKYNYYIKHDSERERIAKNGRKFVEENMLWENKAGKIIELIKIKKIL